MRQLSPLDAVFLYLDSEGVPAHGTFVWIYDSSGCDDGGITRKVLMDHMQERLNWSQVFCQKVHRLPFDYDYPYWVTDESFELLYHIRERSLPSGSSWADFCALVSEVHTEPLDQNHPLWQMTLVRNLDDLENCPAQCFAILGKFHHAAIDGATGMNIISRIHEGGDDVSSEPETTRTLEQPSMFEASFRSATRNIATLNKFMEMSAASSCQRPQVEPKSRDARAPLPQAFFNAPISTKRVFDLRRFDMAAVKALRRLVPGATVNDVLLCICAGGLRDYMQQHDELPDSSLIAGCPVNIRTEQEAEAEGNYISAMTVSLYTSIDDPVERLRSIAEASRVAKEKLSGDKQRRTLDLVGLIPAQAQAALGHLAGQLVGHLDRAFQFNAPVSNLPGPQHHMTLAGARLVEIGAAMPVMNGYGLFLGLCTCEDNLTISATSAPDVLPDPALLGDGFDRAFSALQLALTEADND